jgi:hypothetical protein
MARIRGLKNNYDHRIVKHSSGEYVNGTSHTNTIEGFWGLLKRSIYGIYHSVSPKHLAKYCSESAFRYNTRTLGESERFNVAISQCVGNLTYFRLTEQV